jgi:hypothetical protein
VRRFISVTARGWRFMWAGVPARWSVDVFCVWVHGRI